MYIGQPNPLSPPYPSGLEIVGVLNDEIVNLAYSDAIPLGIQSSTTMAGLASLNPGGLALVNSTDGSSGIFYWHASFNTTLPGANGMFVTATGGAWVRLVESTDSVDARWFLNGIAVDNLRQTHVRLAEAMSYCSAYGKALEFPARTGDYQIDYALFPPDNLTIKGPGPIWNMNPSNARGVLRGCVFAGGVITYPYQSAIEDIGVDGGSVYEDGEDPKYLHVLSYGVGRGARKIRVDSLLYGWLSVGEVVIVRSDYLTVDKTGLATPTAGERRYGVYDFQVLNAVESKEVVNGEYYVTFEFPFKEDVSEPRLVRFPTGDETIYVDVAEDPISGLSNQIPVKPVKNFVIKGLSVGTTGNQAWTQANCLYKFAFEDINVLDGTGFIVGNAFNHGHAKGFTGTARGPIASVAFTCNDVVISDFNVTVKGRFDERNPGVDIAISGSSNRHVNMGKGAVDSEGNIDLNFDAIVYSRLGAVANSTILIYNKDNQEWNYITNGDVAFFDSLSEFTELPGTASVDATGFGSDIYIPTGSDSGVSVASLATETRSTINPHESCRDVEIHSITARVEDDYDSTDQDLNLVGKGIKIWGISIQSDRYYDASASLEGNSVAIGNVINGGEVPHTLTDISVWGCTFNGKPVSNGVEGPSGFLYPSKDTSTMRVRSVSNGFPGTFTKATNNYFLNGNTYDNVRLTRAADATTNYIDRYACYYNTTIRKALAYSDIGIGANRKGWYLIPLSQSNFTEPASAGGTVSEVDNMTYDSVILNTTSNTSLSSYNSTSEDRILYLGEDCGRMYFGPFGVHDNGTATMAWLPDNNPYRTLVDIRFRDLVFERPVRNLVKASAGVRNLYAGIRGTYAPSARQAASGVVSPLFLVDAECILPEYSQYNTFEDISYDGWVSTSNFEPYRDQGLGNSFRAIKSGRDESWRAKSRRYVRNNAVGSIRRVLDGNTAAGTAYPALSSNITVEKDFDTIAFAPAEFRFGYRAVLTIVGQVTGAPVFQINGDNGGGEKTLVNHACSGTGAFIVQLEIMLLDRLGGLLQDEGWVGVYGTIRDASGATSIGVVDTVFTSGATREIRLRFEFPSEGSVNIHSYQLDCIDNIQTMI